MKVIKWIVLFIVAFLISWALIFTFGQDAFKTPVQALLLTYKTPAIPIYFYVAGAFGTGLLIGLLVALYYFIVLKAELLRRGRKLKSLESELATSTADMSLNYDPLGSVHQHTGSKQASPENAGSSLNDNSQGGVQQSDA